MNRPRRVPSAHENEKPDEEIQQRGDAQVILNRGGIFLRSGDQRDFKRLAVAADSVAELPSKGPRGNSSWVTSVARWISAPRTDSTIIALLDSSPVGRRAGSHVPGHYALGGIHPRDAVIGDDKSRTLLEVQNGKNHRRQREQRQR